VIEQAYRRAEELGIEVWCQDEAGPYQTKPYTGGSWQPHSAPAQQPHEYIKTGTAKLLTLFRPASGQVRGLGVTHATNAVLHPWLKAELASILQGLGLEDEMMQLQTTPKPPFGEVHAGWEPFWLGVPLNTALPPLRIILIWDNLAGHTTHTMVEWLYRHGILPLYTPLGGSWLNMAESVQRILVRRALDGQHPESPAQVIEWLEETVAGWNTAPTPFEWGGKRQQRRERARARRLGGSGAVVNNGNLNVA
jgi:hypothetical protein